MPDGGRFFFLFDVLLDLSHLDLSHLSPNLEKRFQNKKKQFADTASDICSTQSELGSVSHLASSVVGEGDGVSGLGGLALSSSAATPTRTPSGILPSSPDVTQTSPGMILSG